ncbi:hypothetical protein C5C27_02120 [Rathayibacter sp. AY2B7]|nr:hypothetical protein C5C27_02120 [Rathayibacter sp. AY2B7]
MSGSRCPVSGVRCPVSGVRCPVSGVRCPVSGVRCPVPSRTFSDARPLNPDTPGTQAICRSAEARRNVTPRHPKGAASGSQAQSVETSWPTSSGDHPLAPRPVRDSSLEDCGIASVRCKASTGHGPGFVARPHGRARCSGAVLDRAANTTKKPDLTRPADVLS